MTDTNTNRVVVTGLGWVTPLGHDIESVWQKLLAGQSAMGPITSFDASTYPSTFAAHVKNYDFRKIVTHPEYHQHVGLNTSFALGAAVNAWKMSGLDNTPQLNRNRVGIYLGTGEGTLDFDNYSQSNIAGWDDENHCVDGVKWVAAAKQKMNLWREIEQEANMTPCHVATELNIFGPSFNCLTACAASTQAIGEAYEILKRGDADVMVSGGAHTMIHPLGLTGFNRLTALSQKNDDPHTASCPFNRTRDGFVLGEGSGMIILENLEHAKARNATILAEIAGFGTSADAFRITDIQPQGQGAVAAMTEALEKANITPNDIDYISAHGTSTKENDSIETIAVKKVFGDNAKNVPINSIKGMIGHLIAAAGSVEAITCILTIRDGKIPPTINLNDPDPECDLDYVPNTARDVTVNIALSNSFGFGGQNNTLVIKRFTN